MAEDQDGARVGGVWWLRTRMEAELEVCGGCVRWIPSYRCAYIHTGGGSATVSQCCVNRDKDGCAQGHSASMFDLGDTHNLSLLAISSGPR